MPFKKHLNNINDVDFDSGTTFPIFDTREENMLVLQRKIRVSYPSSRFKKRLDIVVRDSFNKNIEDKNYLHKNGLELR